MGKISLLDCTLRDGGYYNNWDFPKDLIDEYLKAMSAAKIEYVELGFRFFKKDIYLGPCAYTTSSFLETFPAEFLKHSFANRRAVVYRA